MENNTLVLLLNLGTPDAPTKSKVRTYLSQFLNDRRVIDIPYLSRKLLVNGIIVPFRTGNSTKIYKKVWTDEGSPLLLYTESLTKKLREKFKGEADVEFAMRYQNPSMESVLLNAQKKNYKRIVVIPLYPQYAASSSGSSLEEFYRIISKWWVIPEVQTINQFFDDEDYLSALIKTSEGFNHEDYDHVIMSYHGLPERQVDKVYNDGLCSDRDCEEELTRENQYCYKAACYATSREIAKRLNIPEEQYTVAFQSRLNDKWLKPFSDKVVEEKAKEGMKKLLVFSPAFTADCLETIYEIGEEYQEIFEEHGGEKVQLVPALNDNDYWVDALESIIRKNSRI